jgi:hypothetical protein
VLCAVQTIQRNDVVVELDDRPSDPQFYRIARVAWLNASRV